jgi:hypothetical protein
MIEYEYTYIIAAERDTEFQHDVVRHEARAMFSGQGSRWMIWIAPDAVILRFVHQADWMNFAAHWSLVFQQLVDDGSLV